MRKIRVTSAMQRLVVDLRAMKSSARKGGVMRVPAILSPHEWEALAKVSQDALIAASYEDRSVRQDKPMVNGIDPADVSNRYQ